MRFLIIATILLALLFTIEDHHAVWEPVEPPESTVTIVSANPTTTIITDIISFSTTTICPSTTPSSLSAGPASSPTIEAVLQPLQARQFWEERELLLRKIASLERVRRIW